jgi:hypothetical protein
MRRDRLLVLRLPILLFLAKAAGAQTSGIDVRVGLAQASYQALKETPFMVSVLKDGAIAQQKEVHANSAASFEVPPSTYDVRVEGMAPLPR